MLGEKRKGEIFPGQEPVSGREAEPVEMIVEHVQISDERWQEIQEIWRRHSVLKEALLQRARDLERLVNQIPGEDRYGVTGGILGSEEKGKSGMFPGQRPTGEQGLSPIGMGGGYEYVQVSPERQRELRAGFRAIREALHERARGLERFTSDDGLRFTIWGQTRSCFAGREKEVEKREMPIFGFTSSW